MEKLSIYYFWNQNFGKQYLASFDQSIPVSIKLIFPSVRNIVPLDINVIISIWSWVLVVESHGVHHLVLDMANQMSTSSNKYWLGQWKWPIHPPDSRKTYPCVQKLNVHWLKNDEKWLTKNDETLKFQIVFISQPLKLLITPFLPHQISGSIWYNLQRYHYNNQQHLVCFVCWSSWSRRLLRTVSFHRAK